MRVLAIICHPDDMEEYCGGTLLACKERGDEVYVCNLCNGSLGSVTIKPEELIGIRKIEAKNACEVGGFIHVDCSTNDLELFHQDKEFTKKVANMINDIDPDFIITHNLDDYMSDHVATSKIVFSASFMASLPNFKGNKKKGRVVPIFYCFSEGMFNYQGDFYVDITKYLDKKIEMSKCHKSQLQWLSDHDNIDFAAEVKMLSKMVGYQCGVEYAECFKLCPAYLKQTTKRLLP